LESCKDLTSKDWTAGYDSDGNHFTGAKTVTLCSGTYTGEFR